MNKINGSHLPTLLFFEEHADPSVSQFLSGNLERLYALGYRNICIEDHTPQTLD